MRIIHRLAIFGLSLSIGGFASVSYADPFSDAAVLLKLGDQLKQLQKQYKVLNRAYDTAKSQLDSIEKLNKYNSGHSGYGKLYNSMNDLKQKQSANSWREALKGVSGGNPGRYKELVSAYEKQHALLNKQQFGKGASVSRTERFEQEREVVQAASIESEASFNDINDSLKRIHNLSEKIESADSTKAAIDLNSRLLTEIAYLEAQNLKAQSIVNQQLAVKSGSNLTDEAELAHYLTLDKR